MLWPLLEGIRNPMFNDRGRLSTAAARILTAGGDSLTADRAQLTAGPENRLEPGRDDRGPQDLIVKTTGTQLRSIVELIRWSKQKPMPNGQGN